MGYNKKSNPFFKRLLLKAVTLNGEKLNLLFNSKEESNRFYFNLCSERFLYEKNIDIKDCQRIKMKRTFENGKYKITIWIINIGVVISINNEPLVFESNDVKNMLKDNLTKDEIKAVLKRPLTKQELKFIQKQEGN